MPAPPPIKNITSMIAYKTEFYKWYDIALNEIEAKVGDYRTDYAVQSSGDLQIQDYDDEASGKN